MGDPLIRVKQLEVRRNGQSILKGLDWSLTRGTPFALVGESGSGKTTLLYVLLGLLLPQRGTVEIDGTPVGALSPGARAHTMGLVFQDFQLFPHLTVAENLTLAPTLHGSPPTETQVRSLLEELHIEGKSGAYPHELSGGQKQRVAIARSLLMNPKVLFFDEPSSALDSRTTEELAQILKQVNERSQVVIVSHDLPFLKLVCPRGALMKAGSLSGEQPLDRVIG